MNRSTILILSAALLSLTIQPIISTTAAAAKPVTISLDGMPVDWGKDVYIDSVTGSTMVPLRAFSEAVNGQVLWNEASESITIEKAGHSIVLRIGDNKALLNAEQVTLTAMPDLKNGVTMVTLRFLSEQLGYMVTWNGKDSIINLEQMNALRQTGDYVLFNPKAIEKLRNVNNVPAVMKETLESVIRVANGYLKSEPLSVMQKKIRLDGIDPHDYISMAIYYWPDPGKPGGKPYLSKDGQVNPEKDNDEMYDSKRKDKMITAVQYLSEAYWLTGNEKYAVKAAELLRYWFINEESRMNPNLEHAQLVPGKNMGTVTGIIDTVTFIYLIDAIKLLESSPSWSDADNKSLKQWFSDYADWLINSQNGQKERATKNNHSVWYHAQLATYLWYAGRTDLAKATVKAGQALIAGQIEPDGSMPQELRRTRSMHYTIYTLQAFTTLARIGELVNEDLFHYQTGDGRSIQAAFEFLLPYLIDGEKWKYEAIMEESEAGFAPHLLAAAGKIGNERYIRAANLVLGKDKGKTRLAAYTLSE
jgi:hypothetical protein